jgi:UPF0755 protein
MRRFLIIFTLILAAMLAAAAWVAYSLCVPYGDFPASGVFVDIPKGTSVRGIANLLCENGVIRGRLPFLLLARRRANTRLEAGEYFFNRRETALEIFDTIAAGRVFTISITIPEGFNTLQIAALLDQNGLVSRDAFLAAVQDTTPIRDLAPGAPSLEGFLFPSTYQFPHHVTPAQVIAAMTFHFRTEWNSLLAADPAAPAANPAPANSASSSPAANLPANLTPKQIVTLASLVESETPNPEERPIVARVFLNRLKIGLPMQCDPTVIYALELAGKYTPPLTGRDLSFDSAYNTYRHPGLPPGPIANPGEASLRAALAPANVDYLYFVADTEGGHLFSSTLAEHNRNVARYRRLLNQNGAK